MDRKDLILAEKLAFKMTAADILQKTLLYSLQKQLDFILVLFCGWVIGKVK